ncbi:glycoside hydrolase family 43 protein [Acidicapsa ligni]|uniref:glycoside hydrolase family 43 protein n=1 Tax=Acidicapsa ligni TaxID=542300 RepID=UPI0021E06850|nr:glycoside hydrolase family 43 protein [Acidicapsa ligni]
MKKPAFVELFVLASLLIGTCISAAQSKLPAGTFKNPLLSTGPDPWVIRYGGFYYYMNSTGTNLTIRKTSDITDLAHAETKIVWTPPSTGPYSKDLWAPELHRFDDRWYIYFAADDGPNEHHRIYVVENTAADPLDGTWEFKGKVSDATNKWAIDASVFEDHNQRYILWSGWEGDTDGEQRIYIAHLKNPWTVDSPRAMLSYPQYPWERVGDLLDRPAMPHVNVNEGPEILQHNEDIFLVYSGSACWTDYYALGVIRAKSGTNLLDQASWMKYDHPFFKQDREAKVFGTGHNGFFKSPDGKQDWIIYHANPASGEGCGDHRSPRIQPFTWNPDGTPNFGKPIATDIPIEKPSN